MHHLEVSRSLMWQLNVKNNRRSIRIAWCHILLCRIVTSVVCATIATPSLGQQGVIPNVWPRQAIESQVGARDLLVMELYFRHSSDLVFESDGRRKLYLNGYQLPFEIEFPTAIHYQSRKGKDSNPIRFVLVAPFDVEVDDLVFPLDRPFYLAMTEFSIVQRAGVQAPIVIRASVPRELSPAGFLLTKGSFDQTYSAFIDQLRQNRSREAAALGRAEIRTEFLEYYDDPDKPYIIKDLSEIRMTAAKLSASWGSVYVRLPSIAEWFAAMRTSQEKKYWWGNDWNPPDCWFPEPGKRDFSEILSQIRSVNDGQANPIGLIHVIGNLDELVMPTRLEREVIYNQLVHRVSLEDLRENKAPIDQEFHNSQLMPYSFISLGGNVAHPKSVSEEFAVDLERRIMLQYQEELLANMPLGIRWAVEIPPGDVTYGE